jgi:hypothetical protein
MKSIFNTYVVMESQEQCDRMKQVCIDNNLPIWDSDLGWRYAKDLAENENAYFCIDPNPEDNNFFIGYWLKNENPFSATEVTESEWLELLKLTQSDSNPN